MVDITLNVNGTDYPIETEPTHRLLDVLRQNLKLTGTKEGCGEGECGACTVLLDDVPVNACLIPVAQAQGHRLVTIEGLAAHAGEKGDSLMCAVQQALVEHGGTQCGICTPGIAMCAHWAIKAEPNAERPQLRELLAGNLCRCTGYQKVIDSVQSAMDTP